MSINYTSRPVPLGAIATFRVVNFFDNAITHLAALRSTYKTANVLNGLSEQQLEDIGLCRADIANTSRILTTQKF